MAQVYRETRNVVQEFVKWVDNKRVTVKPSILATVTIEVDMDALFDSLGRRAARSKGGKSVLGGGMVTAKRLSLEGVHIGRVR
jgi:hypothetical protein